VQTIVGQHGCGPHCTCGLWPFLLSTNRGSLDVPPWTNTLWSG